MTDKTDKPADKEKRRFQNEIRGMLVGLLAIGILFAFDLAAEFIVPVVAALIIYLLLSPISRYLTGLGLSRMLAALIIVPSAVASIAYGAYALADPAAEWFARTPTLGGELRSRMETIMAPVEKVKKATEKVEEATGNGEAPPKNEVTVKKPGISERLGTGLKKFGVGMLVVIILVFFLLAYGEDLKANLIRSLRDPTDREAVQDVVLEVEREVSVYLGTIAAINLVLGVAIAVGLHLLGFPNAALWGAIAAFANFIPYFGPIAALGVTAIAGLISAPSVEAAALGVLLHGGLNFVEGQLLTPMIVGKRLTVSPIVVFLSVAFWGWLWGVPGALMAIPILLTVRVISTKLESLRPLLLLLGGDPPQQHGKS